MMGRKPSVALEELARIWGEARFAKPHHIPTRRYDLVVAQEPTARVGLPSLVASKLSAAALACEVHGDYLGAGFLPAKDRIVAPLILRSADFVRAVNRRIASRLRSMGLEKVVIIPSVYVKLDVFRPTTNPEERSPVVVAAGRMSREKGLDLLLQAFSLVLREVPDAELRLLGDGPELDRLVKVAQRLGLSKALRPSRRWLTHAELAEQYNQAAVYACTSLFEGGPRTVFEAAACLTPTVSTFVGIIPEVFSEDSSVLFVKRRDPRELADKLLALITDPARRKTIASNAREIVMREFEWGKAVQRYAETYASLVSELG